jgi:hypothetical protein
MGVRLVGVDGHPLFVLTEETYSKTTSKHQSLVRRAVYGDVYTVPIISRVEATPDVFVRELARAVRSDIDLALKKAAAMRKSYKRYDLGRDAARWRDAVLEIAGRMGMAAEVRAILGEFPKLAPVMDGYEEYHGKMVAARERRERREREVLDIRRAIWSKEHAENAEAWRAGENVNVRLFDTMLRLTPDGKTVQTSRDAHISADVARRFWKMWRLYVDSGREYVRGNHTVYLGPFPLTHISKDGDITVGCHYIKHEELERMEVALGLSRADSYPIKRVEETKCHAQ